MATRNDSLAIETRSKTGTTAANALRRAGKIPGVIFGHGAEPTPIAVDAREFDALLHAGGKNHLLNVTIDGKTKDTALVRDVQRHPISRRVLHADLQRVSATEEIWASLPLVPVGVPEGVKNSGGVMDVISHTIDVSGPANALPEKIEIDVSALGLHDHITAGEVPLPPKLKLDMDPATVLIAVEPSRTEREAEAAATAAPIPAVAEVPTVAETTAEAESGT
ncbi:MAG TPA: 50S ribosomal protein L25 [Candidatus Baltobacteraceae bacterium]|nr:50S ribosomal protein L25 [Candidatus Baltobacteraceae bacterium]